MNRLVVAVAALSVLSTTPCSAAEEFQLEEGFLRLENGRDLTGWTGQKRDWSVVDGAIHLEYKTPPSWGAIYCAKTHSRDCIIRLQFRASFAADSGVFIHGRQFQVRDYPNSFPGTRKWAPYAKGPGEWNDLEFDFTDGVGTVKLNGHVIQEDFKMGDRPDQGIGLQKERGDFDYRYIRIKENGPPMAGQAGTVRPPFARVVAV